METSRVVAVFAVAWLVMVAPDGAHAEPPPEPEKPDYSDLLDVAPLDQPAPATPPPTAEPPPSSVNEPPAQGERALAPPETTKRNSINVGPVQAIFGSYVLNYERILSGGEQGILFEVWHHDVTDREQIVSQRASGVALGLRVHLSGAQQGWLAGLNASYSQGEGDVLTTQPISGTPTVKEELIDVKFSLAQLMGNVGYRWLWDSGLNITWRIGLGLGVHVVETDVEGHFGEHATDEIKRLIGIDGPLATNAELSVGYNF